jgi:hypothetical protein
MPIKIIDNKKVDMTQDEFDLYYSICRSYDRPNFKGEDLFKDLFESDDLGRIIFLKPPSTRHTSMEVFLFISILMQQQHIRSMQFQVSNMCKMMKEKIDEVEALKASLKEKIETK